MVYVVATRGKLLKGTSREQAFLQKRPVAIKHFCERDQSRSQITTSNYKLEKVQFKFQVKASLKIFHSGEIVGGSKLSNWRAAREECPTGGGLAVAGLRLPPSVPGRLPAH